MLVDKEMGVFFVGIISAVVWVAVGTTLFVLFSRRFFLSGFSKEDIPVALAFGGLSGPFVIFLWVIFRRDLKPSNSK